VSSVPSRPKSASVLEKALARSGGALTVADASAQSGIPLRDAEEGLRWLAAEFGGHLAATEKGELLYSFPNGLQRAPEKRWWRRGLSAVGRGIAGVGRFIVRAWVSVVLIAYALAFVALMIALALRGGDNKDDGPSEALGIVLRVIAEALYWTFHPFSPVYFHHQASFGGGGGYRRQRQRDDTPFYEKVNRFVFGPRPPERDPREDERNVLAEIRAQAGRVTPADVMRVTGLPRERAEALLLRLLVDYQGELEVTDSGAIVYRFSDLRATAQAAGDGAPPFWSGKSVLAPLTGNTGGSNFLFAAINAFNLAASTYVLANGWTLDRIGHALEQMNQRHPLPLPPPEGIPIVLGAVPFVFSAALFALPLFRLLRRPAETRKVARENGWRGVLRLAVTGRRGSVIQTRAEMERAWLATAGVTPTEAELTDAVRAAGGEVDVGEDGQLIYKFDLLEGELRAAEDMRQAASREEANPGRVVFSSADEGPGMREERPATPPGNATPGKSHPDAPRAPAALPARPEVFPESQEELLNRIGVDTRRRER
jgi:hypothetical protein